MIHKSTSTECVMWWIEETLTVGRVWMGARMSGGGGMWQHTCGESVIWWPGRLRSVDCGQGLDGSTVWCVGCRHCQHWCGPSQKEERMELVKTNSNKWHDVTCHYRHLCLMLHKGKLELS